MTARLTHQLQVGQRIAALLTGMTGLLGAAGWLLHSRLLIQLQPQLVSMKFNTALGLMVVGVALLLLRDTPGRWSRLLGGAVAVLGILTSAEYFSGRSLGLDNFFMQHPAEVGSDFVGRMSLITALLFAMLGSGIVAATIHTSRGARWSQRLALLALALSSITILGFAEGLALILRGSTGWATIALNTAVGLAFASLALLWARPVDPAAGALLNASGLAGTETRRFVFLLLPGLFLALTVTKVTLDLVGTGSDLAEGIRNLVLIIAAGWAVVRTLTNLAKAQSGSEEQVQLRTTQLRAALEGAELGLWQLDLATEMMVVDEGTARILGGQVRAGVPFAATEWRALVHPDDRPGSEGALAAHLADTSRRFGLQYRLRHADGTWRWIDVKARAVAEPGNGAPRQVIGIVADVTGQCRLEEQLRDSETKLRLSLDAASLGLFDLDIANQRLWLDEGAFRILGLPLRDPPVVPVAEYQALVHPDDFAASSEVVQRLLAAPAAPIDHEYRIRRPDGSWVWVHWRGRGMDFGRTAVPSRLMGVLADASARKALEAVATQHRKDLETLLYVASHDLREPLRAIENFAQLVRNEYADKLDERGRDFLDRVVRAAVRLHHLLEELQGVAKAQGAGLELHRVTGATLADEVLGRMEHRARELKASITIADDLPDLLVDATWATQALYNLVANACKFSPRGVPPVVEIAGIRQAGQVGFSVSDHGLGVPEEIRESIFELFRRGVGREVEGTGAGLAIVRQVATRHGGRAWVEPREGGGSIFYVTFGAAPAIEAA